MREACTACMLQRLYVAWDFHSSLALFHWLLFAGLAVVEGWLDLAKLVATEGAKGRSPYEELAYQIGEACHLDSGHAQVLQGAFAGAVASTSAHTKQKPLQQGTYAT